MLHQLIMQTSEENVKNIQINQTSHMQPCLKLSVLFGKSLPFSTSGATVEESETQFFENIFPKYFLKKVAKCRKTQKEIL